MTPLELLDEAEALHEKLVKIAFGARKPARRNHAARLLDKSWHRAMRRALRAGVYDRLLP